MTHVRVQPPFPHLEGRTSDAPLVEGRRYWLCQHVYLCCTQSGVVFLDIRRDRYFGLSGMQLRALSQLVEDWPQQPHLIDPSETLLPRDASNIADRYVKAGLLTWDREVGKPATPVSVDLGRGLIAIGPDVQRNRTLGPGDMVRFVLSYLSVAYTLRFISLELIVQNAIERKRLALTSGNSFSLDLTIELVCLFRRLRAFVVFGQNHCLFHALALTDFLARYGQFPTWVIGVRTDPWAAHSWVQQDHYVLDCTPEQVRFYTPILAV